MDRQQSCSRSASSFAGIFGVSQGRNLELCWTAPGHFPLIFKYSTI
jgi:hypothetical protein